MSAVIIVPTYNEVENIGPMLDQLSQAVPDADVLVVDDNSPDGTQQVVHQVLLRNPRAHLLERPGKEGLAAAYIAGFHWAMERGYERILQMDADFSHDPQVAGKLLSALADHELVIGSRYTSGGGTEGWPWHRQLISRAGNFYAKSVLSTPYRDLTGGFNAWRTELLKAIDFPSLRSRGYVFQVELKYRAYQRRAAILEIPILFRERVGGRSKMSKEIFLEAAVSVFQMRHAAAVG